MRDMTAAALVALSDQSVRPALFFEAEFVSGTIRLWSGLGPVSWAGQVWTGLGNLIGIGALDEGTNVVAQGTVVALSGVDPSLVSAVIIDAQQGLPGKIWLGFLAADGTVIVDPVQAFAGRLDVPQISDGADTCTITISYESRLIDLQTPREWRYTHESQLALFSGDLGFEFVTSIQEAEITWGR